MSTAKMWYPVVNVNKIRKRRNALYQEKVRGIFLCKKFEKYEKNEKRVDKQEIFGGEACGFG